MVYNNIEMTILLFPSNILIGGRPIPEYCELRLHNPVGESSKEDIVMLTLSDFIAVTGLCITCFGLGYTVGLNSKAKK